MKTYYIYTLKDPITNQIRYIGKTTNIQKRYYHHCSLSCCNRENTHRSSWIKSLLIKKVKPIIEVIDTTTNWQEKEIYWIKYYKSLNTDLCNHTLGGDGGLGIKRYKEFKVYQFDKKGNLLNIYNSTKEASILTNINFEYIKRCIRGIYKTAGNYIWSKDEQFKLKNRNHNAKAIIQLSKDSLLIKEFNSITEASKLTSIQRNSIKNCCNNKQKTAGGYKWQFKNN